MHDGIAFADVGILEGSIACNTGLAILLSSFVSAKVSQHRMEKIKEELESSTKEEFDIFEEYNLTDEDNLNKDRQNTYNGVKMKVKECLEKVYSKLKELPQEKLAEIEKTIDEDIEKFFSTEADENDITISEIVVQEFPFLFR